MTDLLSDWLWYNLFEHKQAYRAFSSIIVVLSAGGLWYSFYHPQWLSCWSMISESETQNSQRLLTNQLYHSHDFRLHAHCCIRISLSGISSKLRPVYSIRPRADHIGIFRLYSIAEAEGWFSLLYISNTWPERGLSASFHSLHDAIHFLFRFALLYWYMCSIHIACATDTGE